METSMEANTRMSISGPLQPWQQIAWSPQQVQKMYCDWGTFFSQQQELDVAAHYYDKSLELREDDVNALYFRSVCKRNIAQTAEALQDALKASSLRDYNPRNNIAIAAALYELNEFEASKIELHDCTRKYCGSIVDEFQNSIVVVDRNIEDCLGEPLEWFFLKQRHCIGDVVKMVQRKKHHDTRPLWKQLKEKGKCDVLSILEKEEPLLSPREKARRERSYRIYNQIYLGGAWTDMIFTRNLKNSASWRPPHHIETTPYLQNLISTKFAMDTIFLRKLHARSPLYNEYATKFPNRKLRKQHREKYLSYVQYQTHRDMMTVLRQIKILRKYKKIERLAQYIEGVMGDLFVLKTHRVMPWKFEFMNEVYNTFALAVADQFVIPQQWAEKWNEKNRLLHFFNLRAVNKDRPVNFTFGKKSTYFGANAVNAKQDAYLKLIARLENREYFAKYSIEKCFLWHEMARLHLKHARCDECYYTAKRAIEEAKNCNNLLWAFLGVMMTVKAHALLGRIERCKESLEMALEYATQLKDEHLCAFVEAARQLNDETLGNKRKTRSEDSIRRRSRLLLEGATSEGGMSIKQYTLERESEGGNELKQNSSDHD